MTDRNNILLITDSEDIANDLSDKLILLREYDHISVCSHKEAKKVLTNSLYYTVILHELEDDQNTIKAINNIKNINPDLEILLLLNSSNKDFILNAYDNGIFDYFFTDSEDWEIMIKTINCFKQRIYKEVLNRNNKFLTQMGVIDTKTNLYQYKYLKENFIDLCSDIRIQNGTFVILMLDENIKTKVSTNRLAGIIKSSIRSDDIAATARGGKFYLVLPNTNLNGAKSIIQKFQDKMGQDYQLRAGLSKIGLKTFETLDKNAQDSLVCAVKNNLLNACLEDNLNIQNSWLEDESTGATKKSFKLFHNAYINKLENVITPIFFRFKKECETKLRNTDINQYANDIESVFCLKNDNLHSELIIHYDGFAKLNIQITHSGLDSPENTSLEIPLSKLTDKYLLSLLKQLKDEFIKGSKSKG